MTVLMLPGPVEAQISDAAKAITDKERAALFPTREMVKLGESAALANCAGCHGMDGVSQAVGEPNIAGQRTVYIYRALKAFQSGERPEDPKHHNDFLDDNALLSAAVYYSNLAPVQKINTVAVSENEKGGAPAVGHAGTEDDPFLAIRDSMRKCVKCHGQDGNSSRSGMPRLTGQHPEYFVSSMMAYVDGSRNHRLMGKLVADLDEATIRDMGVFYAVQEPVQTETLGDGDVNVGRRLSEACAACHGEDGNAGKPSMPTLAGQDAKYFVKGMEHYKNGERQHQKMFEAVEQLSEQDMQDLASYYAAQKPLRRDVRTPLKSAEWIERCERCHGINGNSSDPRFPMLAGQDEAYLRKALTAYASGGRDNTTMRAMAEPLSVMDIERIGAYFASQQPKAVVYMHLPCGDGKGK